MVARSSTLQTITSTLLVLSSLCSIALLGIGATLLAGHYSFNTALHKTGFSIGLASTVLLLPLTTYSLLKRNSQWRTAFARWQGCISWLFSTAIIVATSVILAQSQKKMPYYICAKQAPNFGYHILFCQDVREHMLDLALVVVSLLLGVFLNVASLLVICKPRPQLASHENKSTDSIESGAMSIKSAMAYLDTLAQLEYKRNSHGNRCSSPAYSIPRKRVDYLAYEYEDEKSTSTDDDETQVGHSSSSSPLQFKNYDEILAVAEQKRVVVAPPPKTLQSKWQGLPRPYRARVVAMHPQALRNFQSLDGASLAVTNSL